TVTGLSISTSAFDVDTNSVVITGTNFATNFAQGGKVTFGGAPALNIVLNSNTSITCTVQKMLANITSNPAYCVVTNPDNSSNAANHPADTFNYTGLRAPENQ